jgi:hypothetical protein
MATDKRSIVYNYETLTALGLRLVDHGETLAASPEHEEIVIDLARAARACSNFATLQFRVGEIAQHALERPAPTLHRDLFAAIEAAQRPEPPDWPEPSRSSHHSS